PIDIVQPGRVIRGWVGLQVQELTPRLAQALGAGTASGLLVTRISAGSPAEQAGLRPGDVLLSLDGEALDDGRQAMLSIAWRHPGDQARFTVWREGETRTVAIRLATEPGPTEDDR